jgi:hypothetical protein
LPILAVITADSAGKPWLIISTSNHSEPSGRIVAARKLRRNSSGRLGVCEKKVCKSMGEDYCKSYYNSTAGKGILLVKYAFSNSFHWEKFHLFVNQWKLY